MFIDKSGMLNGIVLVYYAIQGETLGIWPFIFIKLNMECSTGVVLQREPVFKIEPENH